jgi:hypothetical protein
MKPVLRGAAVIGALLLVAGAVWAWYALMEKRVEADFYLSPAALENPMLAASELLQHHGHAVRTEDTLAETLRRPLPDGTLILADVNGAMSAGEFEQLLVWTRRGNTLIAAPAWAPGAVGAKALARLAARRGGTPVQADPLGSRTGIALGFRSNGRRHCDPGGDDPAPPGEQKNKPRIEHYLACLTLPGAAYPLALETGMNAMEEQHPGRAALWRDREGVAVRAYAEGNGRLVLIARNFFDNQSLRQQDHAELLLALAAIKPGAAPVVFIQHLDTLHWYRILWLAWGLPLCGLALFLLLLLWRALRRFGPLLGEPPQARRALLQHVEASGNWLWQAPGGREMLLAAARRHSAAHLQRRLPEWPALTPEQQLRLLATHTTFSAAELGNTLHAPAAVRAPAFARQIQILQQLRKQYEPRQ